MKHGLPIRLQYYFGCLNNDFIVIYTLIINQRKKTVYVKAINFNVQEYRKRKMHSINFNMYTYHVINVCVFLLLYCIRFTQR